MKRKLNLFGIFLIALFATSGLAVSTAAAGVLTATSYPVTPWSQAEGNIAFDFTGGEFVDYECGTMHLPSEALSGSTSTFVMHPVFTSCRHNFLETPITTTGCDFRFHIGETIGETGNYAGTVDLVCETGKSLGFPPIAGCEVKIDSQEEFGSVEFVNMSGAKSDFTIKWNVKGFQYTVVKDGFGCPYSGLGTKEDGDFTSPPATVENIAGSAGLQIEM